MEVVARQVRITSLEAFPHEIHGGVDEMDRGIGAHVRGKACVLHSVLSIEEPVIENHIHGSLEEFGGTLPNEFTTGQDAPRVFILPDRSDGILSERGDEPAIQAEKDSLR